MTRDWLEERKSAVEEPQHIKTLARMVNDVFPWIGNRPSMQIDAPEILAVLERLAAELERIEEAKDAVLYERMAWLLGHARASKFW